MTDQTHTIHNSIEVQLTEIHQSGTTNKDNSILGEIICYTALYSTSVETSELLRDTLCANKELADLDTTYLHEVMKRKYLPEFRLAISKEVDERIEVTNPLWPENKTIMIRNSPPSCIADQKEKRHINWKDGILQSISKYRWLVFGERGGGGSVPQ